MEEIFNKHLTNINLIQKGVLDNLSDKELKYFTSIGMNEDILVSRLKNGKQLKMNSHKVEKRIEELINQTVQEGYKNILVLCTGRFNNLQVDGINIFFPDDIVTQLLNNMYSYKNFGLLIPDENQIIYMKEKWSEQRNLIIECASPYLKIEEIISSCKAIEEQGAEVILMDCMGYTENMKKEVQTRVNIPVILSNVLTLKIVSELV